MDIWDKSKQTAMEHAWCVLETVKRPLWPKLVKREKLEIIRSER